MLSKIHKELLRPNSQKTTWLIYGPKTLTDTSPKKIYRWQISIGKDAPHPRSSGKCKIKQQQNTTTHLPEWPKSEHWQHQMLTRMWSNRTLICCLWKCKIVQSLWDIVLQFLTKLNTFLPYDPAIVLLLFTQWSEGYVHTKSYIWMFIEAFFIAAKTWKQSRGPSVDEWINELWYIQTMEYYSALKRNKLSGHKKPQRNLFFFKLFLNLFIYLFIFGCVGSSFLCEGFLWLWRAGAALHRGARASHCRGLSCCGAQAPDTQAQ